MNITEGYYKSDIIKTEEKIASGVLKDSFYKCYKFFKSGIWVSKNVRESNFDFELFISRLNLTEIKNNISENDPVDKNYEFLYNSGKYQIIDNKLFIHYSDKIVIKHSFTYSYNIINANSLRQTNGKNELKRVLKTKTISNYKNDK